MFSIIRHFLCVLVIWAFTAQVQGQQWQLDSENPPVVTVTGTSTLHDWTVACAEVQEVPAQLALDPGNPGQITEFGFKVPVAAMDGGRGSSMNDKIFEAFKSAEHPFVSFQQTAPASYTKAQSGQFTITSTGTLTMAGASKSVEIECTGKVENGKLIISGSKSLKMSDFNMAPPTAMFGQIKTNDDVVVNYQFQYLEP